jgi:CBS domain containing-hemolysin-like protein
VIWLALLATVGLLLANGFFVALEFAVVGSRTTKLESEAAEGDRAATHALAAVREVNLQLSGAQLGITMASLGLGVVTEPAVAELLATPLGWLGLGHDVAHGVAVVAALTIVVFLHMVVGEIVPKNIALTDPEQTLVRLAPWDRVYLAVFRPIIRLLNAVGNLGVRAFGVHPVDELHTAHTADELAMMVAASREEGVIEDFAADLLAGVLDFGDLTVADVMAPREAVDHVGQQTSVAEAERLIVERGHSRLPVVGRDLDDVRGFIHAKDLLVLPPSAAHEPVPARLVRRMLVVRQDRTLEDLLLTMRRTRVHFALVTATDDGASAPRTAGVVTLEDLLEELVGDILDETDRDRGRHHPSREPGPRGRTRPDDEGRRPG